MELLDQIQSAFPLAPLPEMTLHQGHLADDSIRREISDAEWQAAEKRDAGQTWATLSDTALMECHCALSHFDEQSFIYHLPAFLRFAICHVGAPFLTREAHLVDSLVFFITDRSPYSLARYVQLTSAQRAAVVSFLQFIVRSSESHSQDAHEALERYWLKRVEPLILPASAR